ncbi:PREDICTED: probable pectinesterase/pectinesterase inhibitor 7 [Fragaria vesca subsp. vesca]|uniref:probable pectinesterase/pectinesterase inhibitor 7 n=1 Tax=Fragaria vesca subsp. vesca TaxID=101020 RepID=UPI0002C32665|nr:PREDICTED: probable pectinesterase/pectinesterase inhibitor 7 [Fragaria vesca subsp. vesca]
MWAAMGQDEIGFVVAKDGSANFTTISDAIKAAPNYSSKRINIKVMAGVYNEYIIVGKEKSNLTIIGEGIDKTVISGSRSNATGFRTHDSATVEVQGYGFTAKYLTIENTAGPGEQAVSLLNFIFGNAQVVFQRSNVYARKPVQGQFITITAQGKETSSDTSGTVFQNCTFRATSELINSGFRVDAYLGRPWQAYSTTIIMQSFLESFIDPTGWLDWDGRSSSAGLFYAEYANQGPGANTTSRVNWKEYKVLNSSEASNFTIRSFIIGDQWLPSTGVPYDPNLI